MTKKVWSNVWFGKAQIHNSSRALVKPGRNVLLIHMSSFVADFCQDVTTGGGVLFSTILPILALFGHFWLFFAHVCIVGVLFTGPNSLVVYKKLINIRSGSPPSASRGCGEECLCLQYTLSPLLDRTRENTTLFPIVLSIVLHGIVHCCAHCCSLFCFLLSIISYGHSCVTGVQNFLYQQISRVIYFLCWHIFSRSFIQPRKSLMVRNNVNEYYTTVARYPSPLYRILRENKRYEK